VFDHNCKDFARDYFKEAKQFEKEAVRKQLNYEIAYFNWSCDAYGFFRTCWRFYAKPFFAEISGTIFISTGYMLGFFLTREYLIPHLSRFNVFCNLNNYDTLKLL